MPDPGEAFACWQVLDRQGYEVSWCPGPDGSCSAQCPLVDGGHCAPAQRADVIVCALGLQRAPSRRVVRALQRHLPDTSVIVAATAWASKRWSPLLAGRRSLRLPITAPALLESVGGARGRQAPV